MMKVLLLLHELSPSDTTREILSLFESISDRVELRTLSLIGGPLEARCRAHSPLKVISILATPSEKLSLQEQFKRFLLRQSWNRWVQEFKPDLIYVGTVQALAVASMLRLPKVPVILHVHEMGFLLNHLKNKYTDLFASWPDQYIVVSDAAKRSLLEQKALQNCSVEVIHEWITEADIPDLPDSAANKSPDVFVVGGVGLVGWHKGTDLWLLMAAELRTLLGDRQVRFVWVGTEDTEAILVFQEKANLLGLDAVLEYVRKPENPCSYYQRFDVLAMTSWEDACPPAVLDCMTLQKPVVCFAGGGGAPEEVGETGIVIEAFSPRKMAEAVAELAQSPERRQALGKAARARVLENFTCAVQSPKIYRILEKTAGRSG
jgi:glycosyltransferase involved in cell wall biosynthesis